MNAITEQLRQDENLATTKMTAMKNSINSKDYCNFDELKDIINLNSYTKNKQGVDDNAVIFNQWMQALGYEVHTHEREHIGNHVHYVAPKKEGKKILLLGHLDTVFPPNTFDSFSEDDDWIYGPGVCDMKGGNYVALCALRFIKDTLGAVHNIDMLLVSDEETGSDDSKSLTQQIAPNYDCCLVFEAAGINHDVVVARKGVATFFIDITGKAAHAGNHYTDGVNANLAAAELIIALTKLTDLSKETTVNVGKIKGGRGANTISPSANLVVEARFTQAEEKQRILEAFTSDNLTKMANVAGVSVAVTGGLQRDTMQQTQAQKQLIEHIESVLDEPLVLERRGGVSDANTVAATGVATLDGFGPFGDGDHTIHERASKSSFDKRITQVSKILLSFAQVSSQS